MSAAEKLKALGEAFDTSRFLSTLNYYIGPGARTLTSRENEKMYYDVKAVLVALPQIVAVIELEVEFMRGCEEECLAHDTSWPPLNARDDLVARKHRALAALDEALA